MFLGVVVVVVGVVGVVVCVCCSAVVVRCLLFDACCSLLF